MKMCFEVWELAWPRALAVKERAGHRVRQRPQVMLCAILMRVPSLRFPAGDLLDVIGGESGQHALLLFDFDLGDFEGRAGPLQKCVDCTDAIVAGGWLETCLPHADDELSEFESEGQEIKSQLNDSSYHWIVRSETLAKYLRSPEKKRTSDQIGRGARI